jgi:hypothetical protein
MICLFDVIRIIHLEFVPPKQSAWHSAFKFWNVYGRELVKEDQIFVLTSEF